MKITPDEANAIYVACRMYDTAANLHSRGLESDANTVATKAKALMDKALIGFIEKPAKET